MDRRAKVFAAELIGTMVLILGGPGSAILAGDVIGVAGVAAAFGLSLLVMVYAIGEISQCHINPAVTLGMWLHKKTPGHEVPFYIVGQLLGAAIGGLIIFAIASGLDGFDAKDGFASNGYGSLSPAGYPLGSAIVVEIVFTALLVLTVLATTHGRFPVGFAGIAIGLVLALIHLVTIPVDNASVNPARSFATAIFQRGDALSQLWVFFVFPLIGGAVGFLIWRLIGEERPEPAG